LDEQHEIITAFSEMAPRYEQLMNNELNRFWGIEYHAFVGQLLSDLQLKKEDTILDVATGTSYIPLYLIDKQVRFNKIIGLDITLGMLSRGKEILESQKINGKVPLVCASALQMPFKTGTFDTAICCLATHHMDAGLLLNNIYPALKPNGKVLLADAGSSSTWKNWLIKLLIKSAAFVYFLLEENLSRALAESSAIANIHTADGWKKLLEEAGYEDIDIRRLKSKNIWAPDPIIIRANKKP